MTVGRVQKACFCTSFDLFWPISGRLGRNQPKIDSRHEKFWQKFFALNRFKISAQRTARKNFDFSRPNVVVFKTVFLSSRFRDFLWKLFLKICSFPCKKNFLEKPTARKKIEKLPPEKKNFEKILIWKKKNFSNLVFFNFSRGWFFQNFFLRGMWKFSKFFFELTVKKTNCGKKTSSKLVFFTDRV